MPRSTSEIIRELIHHLNRFAELSNGFGRELQGDDLILSVSLSYSRLQLSIHKSEALYLQYTIHPEAHPTPACYYLDQDKVEALKKHFEPLAASDLKISSTIPSQVVYTRALDSYLTIAESIASAAYLCTAGDDYRPGYFSEIIVQSEGITLRQTNHMNSRSLDHKQNYSLRDLQFFIPSKQSVRQRPLTMNEVYIGTMRISFSDRSSQNNKMCGDRILEKIGEEKARFGRSHL